MAISVTLAGLHFKSKTAAIEHVRGLHNTKYALGERVTDSHDVALISDLLSYHDRVDEKVGPGVAYFSIGRSADYKSDVYVNAKNKCFVIHDIDGDKRDFSWRDCLDNATGTRGKKHAVKEALRNDIIHLRNTLRENSFAGGPVTCPASGTVMKHYSEAQVVHENPDWNELTSSFAATHGGWDAIETEPGEPGLYIGRTISDPTIRAEWIAWWRTYANPKVILK